MRKQPISSAAQSGAVPAGTGSQGAAGTLDLARVDAGWTLLPADLRQGILEAALTADPEAIAAAVQALGEADR